jgi:hypothetical protein
MSDEQVDEIVNRAVQEWRREQRGRQVDRATADSNIYVSALKSGGKPLTLLKKAVEEDVELAISDSILRETLGVLRDKLHRTDEELLADEPYISACTKRIQPTETLTHGSRVDIYARNSAAWSVAHSRKVRGGAPVTSAHVDVTNAG